MGVLDKAWARDPRAECCCWAAVGVPYGDSQCSRYARPGHLTCRRHANLEAAAQVLRAAKKAIKARGAG